jgi:capsule polysaccharide export protein KpsE/RkpR
MPAWLEFLIYRWLVPATIVGGAIWGGIKASRAKFVTTLKTRHEEAADALISVNKELHAEQLELQKVRAERTSEISLQLTTVQAELMALKTLYGEATLQLQHAGIREMSLRAQLEENKETIRKLTARVAELESHAVRPG